MQVKDVQPALYLLNFVKQAFTAFQPGAAGSVLQALLRLDELGHPLLTRSAQQVNHSGEYAATAVACSANMVRIGAVRISNCA
jgi:hypothetical protein